MGGNDSSNLSPRQTHIYHFKRRTSFFPKEICRLEFGSGVTRSSHAFERRSSLQLGRVPFSEAHPNDFCAVNVLSN